MEQQRAGTGLPGPGIPGCQGRSASIVLTRAVSCLPRHRHGLHGAVRTIRPPARVVPLHRNRPMVGGGHWILFGRPPQGMSHVGNKLGTPSTAPHTRKLAAGPWWSMRRTRIQPIQKQLFELKTAGLLPRAGPS